MSVSVSGGSTCVVEPRDAADISFTSSVMVAPVFDAADRKRSHSNQLATLPTNLTASAAELNSSKA
jgi:hypothetical protein